ncbi:MAG: hypothetical protein A2138_16710 [Deltaproteobacteria bacterium RBG_16_71_12]|nr:MAG: hypothetical protein A2138_16710 [Deltaproteobacteria bacterium RBG_16_71_12]
MSAAGVIAIAGCVQLDLAGRRCGDGHDCLDAFICSDGHCLRRDTLPPCEGTADCDGVDLCIDGVCLPSPVPAAPMPAGPFCQPLPEPSGAVVEVSEVERLIELADGAASPGDTLLVADGVYGFASDPLKVSVPDLTIRAASGDAARVIFDGRGAAEEDVVDIVTTGFSLADVTVLGATDNAFKADGEEVASNGLRIHRSRVVDAAIGGIVLAQTVFAVDGGEISCNRVELTDAGRALDGCAEREAISLRTTAGWTVRDNLIVGFYCLDEPAPAAILVTESSADTVVERNVIVDARVGIQLGTSDASVQRVHPGDPCGAGIEVRGHFRGVVRNNFVSGLGAALAGSANGFEAGIVLERACETIVVHNSTAGPADRPAIVVRGAESTGVVVHNHLGTGPRALQDGAPAPLDVGGRYDASTSSFVDAEAGDLHLLPGSGAEDAGDPGPAPGARADDIDGAAVVDGEPDQGADEL